MQEEKKENIPIGEMLLPTKFEPKTNRRFIFALGGEIPPFLVKSVHTPPITSDKDGKMVPKNPSFHFLRVFLWCPICPSTEQLVAEALVHQPTHCDLKYLDPVGTVVSLWEFEGTKIEEVKFSNPDYGNGDLMTCELLVSFKSLNIAY